MIINKIIKHSILNNPLNMTKNNSQTILELGNFAREF